MTKGSRSFIFSYAHVGGWSGADKGTLISELILPLDPPGVHCSQHERADGGGGILRPVVEAEPGLVLQSPVSAPKLSVVSRAA
jgi:hypothetical protein